MNRVLSRFSALGVCLLCLSCVTGGSSIQVVGQKQVDARLALDLLNASIQTYRAYAKMPVEEPEGWKYQGETFQGDDFFLGSKEPRMFGLVLEKTGEPGSVMYAFRGTDTKEEWWDDVQVHPVAFKPSNAGAKLPDDLRVEDGFDKVYQTMKANLFKSLDQHKATKVYVTGHSLGSALSELFVFDLMLSRPDLTVISDNFACPRLGNQAFVNTYTAQAAQKKHATVRFVNTEDIVPKVPLKFDGYVHLPLEFDITFKETSGLLPNFLLRHSVDNYYRVLQSTFGLPDVKAAFVGSGTDVYEVITKS